MDTLHGRDGPGTRKRGRGTPAKLPSTPRPTQRTSELVSPNDTRLAGPKKIGAAGISDELAHPAVSGEVPVDSLVNGFPAALRLRSAEGTDVGVGPGELSPDPAAAGPGPSSPLDAYLLHGPAVYDTGWQDCDRFELRVAFAAGPANQALRDWMRELLLRPAHAYSGEAA